MNTKKSQLNGTVSIITRLFSATRHLLLPGAVIVACATGSAAPALAQSGDFIVRNLVGTDEPPPGQPEHQVTLYCLVDAAGDVNGCKDGLVQLYPPDEEEGGLFLDRNGALAILKQGVNLTGFERWLTLGKTVEKTSSETVKSDEWCASIDRARATGQQVKNEWRCIGITASVDCGDGNPCTNLPIKKQDAPPVLIESDPTYCTNTAQPIVDEHLGAGTKAVAYAAVHNLASVGRENSTLIKLCEGYSAQLTPPRANLEETHLGLLITGLYTPHGCWGGYC